MESHFFLNDENFLRHPIVGRLPFCFARACLIDDELGVQVRLLLSNDVQCR